MVGNLIIISSPSGGGKGTLIREVLKNTPNIGLSVSYTTRQIREGEVDGREYHFVSREKFEELIEQGEFLEYATVHGNYYGTSMTQVHRRVETGQDVILEIDVQGAGIIFEKMPKVVSIFILPPSFEVLKERLTKRATETPEELDLRLRNALEEVQCYKDFKYLVVNDEVARATAEIQTIIGAERLRRDRQERAVHDILNSFKA